ncbi:MAG: hypothetical protein J5606_09175 [Bacteroidales bacterium]|nr:hypothetical protein [Bacteroidales bacterium]
MTKKYFRIGLLILTSLVICFSSSYAQKKQEDPYKRAKAKVKELQKKGETIVAGSSTAIEMLAKHYEKKDRGYMERLGTADNCKSMNVCRQVAMNNAQVLLAQEVSSQIRGALESGLRHDASDTDLEKDVTEGNTFKAFAANLSGCLEYGFATYKQDKNGNKNYTMYFLVDKNKLTQQLERSLKETKLTIEKIKSISDFVKEGLSDDIE